MKWLPVIGCISLSASAAQADTLVVKGELTFNSYGVPLVTECGSDREFRLGVMASTALFNLLKEYDAVSVAGTKPVLVQVSGVLAESSSAGGELTVENPTVVSLASGSCDA